MKWQALTVVFLISASAPLFGGVNPSAQQLLVAAERQAHIFGDPNSPLQLEVDFVAQTNAPVQGHLSLRWQSKDRWWSRVVIDAFQQTTIQNGGKLNTAQNRPEPMHIKELTRLLHFAHAPQELIAKQEKQRTENGLAFTCLQLEWTELKGESHEVCVNPVSREIVSDTWQAPHGERYKELFSNYVDFQGHRYPRKLQFEVDGTTVIAAIVDGLKQAPFDPALLTPPKGKIERSQCAGMIDAKPLKMPDPAFPGFPNQDRPKGNITVSITVLTDGSVGDIQPIDPAARPLDPETLATLKHWKFKPAMCGSDPVISDVQLVVTFRTQ